MNNATSFLLGLVCSIIIFFLSSRQLSNEVQKLVKLINLIIRGIEESGLAKFSRNAKGEAVGMQFDITVSDFLHLSPSASSHSHPAETKSKT